jgi:glycosyltransferase involved in cell wall biosynthesis
MLDGCQMTFAVSRQLQEDLAARTSRPVEYLPNAVSADFISASQASCEAPADLRRGKPIVGCTGTINDAYDWDMIGPAARALPDVDFVFLGSLEQNRDRWSREFTEGMALPNVRWLGCKPFDQLPRYLAHFDVCLSPLRMNDMGHRRSPLRLYDYLATDKPIVSTAVREAVEMGRFVSVAHNVEECIAQIRSALATPNVPEARRRYIADNTWDKRAESFLSAVDEMCSARRIVRSGNGAVHA